MSSTLFIIAPSQSQPPQPLPPSPTLHLLPFALGSSSNPYRTGSSSSHQYFIPRPAPPTHAGITPGALIAAYRGRALVGHPIPVPRGYKGVVLSTTARPDRGGLEDRRGVNKTETTNTPHGVLTPAPSAISAGVSEGRVTRARGAGQVALARPRTRQQPKKQVGRKRIRLDSDDEDDDADAEGEVQSTKPSNVPADPSTPEKRSAGTQPQKVKSETLSDIDVPVIVVQRPTPRKPLAPAPTDTSLAPTETSDGEATVDDEQVTDQTVAVSEHIVPSPATENDPPPFPVSPQQSLTDVSAVLHSQPESQSTTPAEGSETEANAVRVLRPTSTFTEITLWTPDAPLAGFRADEAEGEPSATAEVSKETEIKPTTAQDENEQQASANALKPNEDAGIKLHPGWWRVGGAGEGGDEFVRAMGEWLGMVEMINEPVYLQGEETDAEDDE